MQLDGAPAELEDLAQHLAANGFEVNDHAQLTGKTRLVDFTHATGFMVRMVRDEGRWSVVAGPKAWKDFFEADYWEACLSDRDVPRVASPLELQATWFKARVASLIDVGEDGPLDCMRLARRREALKEMGLY